MYKNSDYDAIISMSPEQRVQERSNDIVYDKICGILIAFAYKYKLRGEHIDILTIKDAKKEIISLIDDNKIKDIPTIQVDVKEYERLKQLDNREIINEFNNRHRDYSHGMVIHKLEETKEDKDQSTYILLIVILLAYIIYKIETYFN